MRVIKHFLKPIIGMRNEDLYHQEQESFSQMSDTEQKSYAYEQSKKPFKKPQGRLNDAVPIEALYKSLLKDFKAQNRYIDELEAENERLKAEFDDLDKENRKLTEERDDYKQKWECSDRSDLVEQYADSEKKRALMGKNFSSFITKHRKTGVDETAMSELLVELRRLMSLPE